MSHLAQCGETGWIITSPGILTQQVSQGSLEKLIFHQDSWHVFIYLDEEENYEIYISWLWRNVGDWTNRELTGAICHNYVTRDTWHIPAAWPRGRVLHVTTCPCHDRGGVMGDASEDGERSVFQVEQIKETEYKLKSLKCFYYLLHRFVFVICLFKGILCLKIFLGWCRCRALH